MGVVRFDYGGLPFEQRLKRAVPMVAAMKSRAKAVEERAKALARAEAYDRGDYMNGIEATAGVDAQGAVGRVNAKDFKSHWIEFGPLGKVKNGAHVLFRSLQLAGLLKVRRGSK